MKKNKMLRMASAMLVLTLLTTSIIGGTFAKYVTTDSAQDAARVAKFGVVATVAGDLFGSTYKAVADGNTVTAYSENGGTVSSKDAADVVAPGTKNDKGMTLSVTGTPEVATKVTLGKALDADNKEYANSDISLEAGEYGVMVQYTGALTADNVEDYYVKDASGNFTTATDATATEVYELRDVAVVNAKYAPITWYVDGTAVADQAAVQTKVEEAFKTDATFAPNTLLNNKTVKITWEWAFGGDAGTITDQDRKDTILGDMMAAQKGDDVTVVAKTDAGYATVTYTEAAAEGTANKIVTASANGAQVACLTVAFNASLTVEQVD